MKISAEGFPSRDRNDALLARVRVKTAMALSAVLALAMNFGSPLAASAQAAPPAPAASAPIPRGSLSEGVAAIVNDGIISTYDLSQRTMLLIATSGVRPTQSSLPQIQQEALRSLIDEQLEIQEIQHQEKEQKFSLMAEDDDVNAEIERIAQGNHLTGAQLLGELASAGVGADTLKQQIRTQISWARWIEGRYGGSRLKVSQTQVNAALQSMEAEAAKPQYEIAEIYIDASRVGGIQTAIDGAKQLVSQMQQGAPFPAVARQFSAASTAANGGDAGWLSEDAIPTEIRGTVLSMRAGQLSDPVVTPDGVYIVLLRDKRAGSNSTVVQLKQAAISLPADAPDAQVETARQTLLALKRKIGSCDVVETEAAKVSGVVAGDLGETDVKDLAPSFQAAIEMLKVGQVSDPIRTNAGLHLIALCGKHLAGVDLPTSEQVEAQIVEQKLGMISKRYLRDLRSSATIETR